jgi:hypothetical protein
LKSNPVIKQAKAYHSCIILSFVGEQINVSERQQATVHRWLCDCKQCPRDGGLPGISSVMIDGELVVKGRSDQTPPPQDRATVEMTYGCPFCA